jgi:hypothetical protein
LLAALVACALDGNVAPRRGRTVFSLAIFEILIGRGGALEAALLDARRAGDEALGWQRLAAGGRGGQVHCGSVIVQAVARWATDIAARCRARCGREVELGRGERKPETSSSAQIRLMDKISGTPARSAPSALIMCWPPVITYQYHPLGVAARAAAGCRRTVGQFLAHERSTTPAATNHCRPNPCFAALSPSLFQLPTPRAPAVNGEPRTCWDFAC